MIKKIIFKTGYLNGDDELTTIKGHRSDILVEDHEGMFYELNVIDLDRLKVDFLGNKKNGKNYFTDTGLIILDVITKDAILKAVRSLIKENFFSTQKPIKKTISKDWFVLSLD